MSGKIEISRELAQSIANYLEGSASTTVLQWRRELLAAPVVERQEPVAEVVMVDPFVLTTGNLHLLRKGDKLYTSPPAPVANDMVRLLTRARVYARGEFRDEIDACLKELNR